MKKILALLLCAVMLFAVTAITACSDDVSTGFVKGSIVDSGKSDEELSENSDQPQEGASSKQGEAPISSNNGENSPTSSTKPNITTSTEPSTTTSNKTSSTPTSNNYTGSTSSSTIGGDYPTPTKGDVYVAPSGNDSAAGTVSAPLKTLATAVARATAGTTIYMQSGVYPNSTRINLAANGTASEPITIQALDWGKVVIDFTDMAYSKNESWGWGLYLTGDYWKIQGLEICHSGDCAIKVEGSHNYIGRCVTHHNGDTGIQLGFGHTYNNVGGNDCSYNTIENCDSYLNYDFDNYGDADGFACKMRNGKGNRFIGCRAWNNNDDAWDLYESDYAVEIINCWAWGTANGNDFYNDEYFSNAAYLAKKGVKRPGVGQTGNGNGIKCGGKDSNGQNLVLNCVAFENDKGTSVKGFDENSHQGGCYLVNCTGWDNGYNFMFENGGAKSALLNCISFYTGTKRQTGSGYKNNTRLAGEIGTGATVAGNTFTLDGTDLLQTIKLTPSDFYSVLESDALAPRKADGALPENGFAIIKESSAAYKAGITGYKYMSNAEAAKLR